MARILLHTCCAPCASAVIERLKNENDLTLFFYNPNISSFSEYQKRLDELYRFNRLAGHNLPLLEIGYDGGVFETAVIGCENEPERGRRCDICFRIRLEKTAEIFDSKYDNFTTTLTVSPHKNAGTINAIGTEYGGYSPSNFKKNDGYKRSIELSKIYNLYRQNFCGCKYSQIVQ